MSERTVRVLVAQTPLRRELGELPAGVELVAEPDDQVELVVLGFELMAQLPGLFDRLGGVRVAQSMFAGVDGIIGLIPEGVTVASASGAHDIGVAEWVVMMLLALTRRLPEMLERQRQGLWIREDVAAATARPGVGLGGLEDLDGARVLVLGHGSIGRAVAARLEPFGAIVTGIARHARADAEPPEALERHLGAADAVVLLLPLTSETERIVDADFIARMKPGALLINAARGRHVDTRALVDALHAGRIRAALDVTDPEPLPPEHPLWRAPGVIITPHVAGEASEWPARAYRIAGEQIRRYAAGEPLLNVRREGAYRPRAR